MNSFTRALQAFLLCAILTGLAGCATTRETPDDTTLPAETPSKDDMSHGWGTNISQ